MEIKHNSHNKTTSITELFGMMPDDQEVYSCKLSNKKGMSLKVITYGATLTELKVPLENGEIVDVVLGFDTLENYLQSFELEGSPYIGATIGRFAGRIHNSSFNLNAKRIQLNKNNNDNSLHGGIVGFSQKNWKIQSIVNDNHSAISLSYSSPANEENYPGNLEVELTYTLTDNNDLIIQYTAKTTEDTIVNLTNHSYFNLDGHFSDVEDQELMVNTNLILESTNENIPTGRFLEIKNTPFDFSIPKKCPSKIDTTFVITKKCEFAASLYSKNNNLKMIVYTDQPGVHIYVGGNCFNIIKGKENANYHPLSGICFETQNFPDAPNHDHFPSAVLKKDDQYSHNTIYKFQSL